MNFAPRHQFRNCSSLEAAIEQLFEGGNVPQHLYDAYLLYHFSLVHKLRSARYHADTIQGYLASQQTHNVTALDVVYRVNFHFDGFTHTLGSALDIFAREILTYFGVALPKKVHYGSARVQLKNARPGDPILPYLDDPTWRDEFGHYRNTATHESVVGSRFDIKVDVQGNVATRRMVFPLPDNPRAAANARTFRRNPDITEYCNQTLRRVLSHFNRAYGHVCGRVVAAKRLPL
jgi:hypothetical protein